MRIKLLKMVLPLAILGATHTVSAIDLSGSPYQIVGEEKGIDPLLLYSISLAESAFGSEQRGMIAPHAWTLRSTTAHYADSRDEAERTLQEFLDSGKTSIDVGLMQVNVRWNGSRVDSPLDLLDPLTNVRVAADILQEAMDSAQGDLALGIGRYHHWEEEPRARNY